MHLIIRRKVTKSTIGYGMTPIRPKFIYFYLRYNKRLKLKSLGEWPVIFIQSPNFNSHLPNEYVGGSMECVWSMQNHNRITDVGMDGGLLQRY